MEKIKQTIIKNKCKIPPSAIDIEEAIIGSLMIDKAAIDTVIQIIKTPQAFYLPAHKKIFKSILELVDDNEPVDLLTLSNQLRKNKQLEEVGGDYALINLSQKVSSAAHVDYHSRIVLQKWVQREVIYKNGEGIEKAYDEGIDIFELLEFQEKALDNINTVIDVGNKQMTFKQAIDAVVKRVKLISALDEVEISGVTTGSRKLDKFTGGWQDGDFIISAARPGMGKTAKMLKNVSEIALRGDDVGIFSLEMPTQQLAARIVSINTHFHLAMLLRDGFKGDKAEDYFLKLAVAKNDLQNLPILIDDRAGITINQLCMKARIWKRKHNIKALFIDYLQLMAGDNVRGQNREAEISNISRRLKSLAKELNIPVIALSQLSRGVETRAGDNRPRLIDLRESGAIEQDADIVEFIYRPEYYGIEPDSELIDIGANTEIIFAKFRNGSTSTRYMYFDGNKAKFLDPEDRVDNDSMMF